MNSDVKPTDPPVAAGTLAVDEGRRMFGSRAGRWIAVITVLVALLATVAIIAFTPPSDRTLGLAVAPVQALISVTVPFLTVLLVTDLRQHRTGGVAPRLVAACAVAVFFALFGLVVCGLVVALFPSQATGGRWAHPGTLVLGSVVVQVIAALSGTGLGLLVRKPVLAMIGTIAFPLGLWLLLGAVDVLRPVQGWVTPFANATKLLSGQMTSLAWLQCLVVIAIWTVGLNVAGAVFLRRRVRPGSGSGPNI